jgi:hypothetical protein
MFMPHTRTLEKYIVRLYDAGSYVNASNVGAEASSMKRCDIMAGPGTR